MTIDWKPIQITLSCLDYWQDNPKLLTKPEAAKLEKSTRKLGRAGVLLVGPDINGRRALYDGHQRANIWRGLYGLDAPIWALESSRPLSDDERRAVSIMTITATGSLDWQKLAGWDFAELQDFGMDGDMLKALNNDANNLKELMRAEQTEPVDAEPQIDRAAELNEKWQVKPGDLWQIGEHRLLCGDSTKREDVERVMGGERADCVITDPPYLYTMPDKLTGIGGKRKYLHDIQNHLDGGIDMTIISSFPNWFCFCSKEQLPKMFELIEDKRWMLITWNKPNPTPLSNNSYLPDTEYIFHCFEKNRLFGDYKDKSRFIVHNIEKNELGHPTVKPLPVLEKLTRLGTVAGETIIDLFAGSGSQVVTCQNLGRKCRAIEISPNYCAVILERMATAFPELEIKRIE